MPGQRRKKVIMRNNYKLQSAVWQSLLIRFKEGDIVLRKKLMSLTPVLKELKGRATSGKGTQALSAEVASSQKKNIDWQYR